MKERLYAARLARRSITIFDVPKDMRDAVMALLGEADRARCERALEATVVKGRPTKAELLKQAESIGVDVPDGASCPEIAELIKSA